MDIDGYKMEGKKKFIALCDLEVYKLARDLSRICWQIYETLDWRDKKIMGYQFIESTDSVGANIAEGYGRFHYLDRIKFYYNSRASLYESCDHWLELLKERRKLNAEDFDKIKVLEKKLVVKLNNLITSLYDKKNAR